MTLIGTFFTGCEQEEVFIDESVLIDTQYTKPQGGETAGGQKPKNK